MYALICGGNGVEVEVGVECHCGVTSRQKGGKGTRRRPAAIAEGEGRGAGRTDARGSRRVLPLSVQQADPLLGHLELPGDELLEVVDGR